MGKFCVIPECRTGRCIPEQKRKKAGLRRLSMFGVPKCKDKLKLWEEALNCTLESDNKICELHFREEDIKKTSDFLLTGGIKHSIPRKIWILSNDAIPIRDKQTTIHKEIAHPVNNMDIDKSIELEAVTPHINESDNTQPEVIVDTNVTDIQSEVVIDLNESESSPSDGISLSNEKDENCEQVIIEILPEGPQIPTENTSQIERLTFQEVNERLKSMTFRRRWSWDKMGPQTIFTLVDAYTYTIRLHLILLEDLSVNIRSNTGAIFNLSGPVNSMEEISAHLETAESFQICTGTGLPNMPRNPECLGILEEQEMYHHFAPHMRCTACKFQRKKTQHQEALKIAREERLVQKYKAAKGALRALKRKLRNSKK